jgi:hypothetical protein
VFGRRRELHGRLERAERGDGDEAEVDAEKLEAEADTLHLKIDDYLVEWPRSGVFGVVGFAVLTRRNGRSLLDLETKRKVRNDDETAPRLLLLAATRRLWVIARRDDAPSPLHNVGHLCSSSKLPVVALLLSFAVSSRHVPPLTSTRSRIDDGIDTPVGEAELDQRRLRWRSESGGTVRRMRVDTRVRLDPNVLPKLESASFGEVAGLNRVVGVLEEVLEDEGSRMRCYASASVSVRLRIRSSDSKVEGGEADIHALAGWKEVDEWLRLRRRRWRSGGERGWWRGCFGSGSTPYGGGLRS